MTETVIFWSIATAAWLVLLIVLLVPLLKAKQTTHTSSLLATPQRRIVASVLLSTFVIGSSAVFYLNWTSGYSVVTQPVDQEAEITRLVEQLAERLRESPDNPDGWLLLANSYQTLEQYDKAAQAYAEATQWTTLKAWAQINYAETLFARDGHFGSEANQLLESALAQEPDNVRGLFLIGLAKLQQKNYRETIAHWQHLVALPDNDPKTVAAVREKIAEIRQLAEQQGQTIAEVATKEQTTEQSAEEGACLIHIQVSLAPELASQVVASDTLFVYAKARQGPPMPLAIKRFTADDLPLQTCLGNADAMIKTMTIEHFAEVIVVARISKSGSAKIQAGDLQGQSEPLATAQNSDTQILINELTQ